MRKTLFLLPVITMILFFPFLSSADELLEEYTLHVDDVLTISVWNHPDLQREVLVGPDGNISFPLAGKIMAVGKTVQELKEILDSRLAETLLNPRVSVSLKQYRRLEVLIFGDVARPGDYQLNRGSRFLDALSKAGGPLPSADLTNMKVIRGNEAFNVDLGAVLAEENMEQNITLRDGDVLYIHSGLIEVTVMGEVLRPGLFELKTGSRVLNAISAAGGPKDTAALREMSLNRGDISIDVNLEAILLDRQTEKNIALEDGDILYIPDQVMEITILGEVKQQGMYVVRSGLRFSDLLAQSGGLLEDAAKIATLNTMEGTETVNLNELLVGGYNPRLKDGDTIFIPRTVYRVAIMGEVRNPGTYPWHSDLRLTELLSEAGNITDTGNKENITIIRDDGEILTVDLQNYLVDFQGQGNPYLEAGDMVIVTEADYIDWEQIFFFIGGLNTLRQILGIEITW